MINGLIYTKLFPANYNVSLNFKTQTLWQKIQFYIGGLIRNHFFMPLHLRSFEKLEAYQEECRFFKDFWDIKKSAFPELPYHQRIKDLFVWSHETIYLHIQGEIFSVTYLLIETKEQDNDQTTYGFIHLLGNVSTVENNIMSTYPFLASYIKQHETSLNASIPPARFILLSHYNTELQGKRYKPNTLNESGLILSETLKKLQKKYGTAHQLVAHSLGTIIFTASLKYFDLSSDRLPQQIHLDRGPSSILKLSERSYGGYLFFLVAFLVGWSIDCGEEIDRFIKKAEYFRYKLPSFIISGALYDHKFPEECNLYANPAIKHLAREGKLTVLGFTPPSQYASKTALHNLPNHLLASHHLMPPFKNQTFMHSRETLSDAVIRTSIS